MSKLVLNIDGYKASWENALNKFFLNRQIRLFLFEQDFSCNSPSSFIEYSKKIFQTFTR